jgi:hypothetical protein
MSDLNFHYLWSMKILILNCLMLIGMHFTCVSQSFSLTGESGEPLANGAILVQSGPSDTLQLITWLNITNNSANTLQVMMRKEDLTMFPGGSASICWGGYCYGPEMAISTFPVSMAPGETVSGCFGHFGPNGCRGVSEIRWAFFNEADPSDSLSISVNYSTFPSATAILSAPGVSFSVAGRNPADQRIMLNYSLPPEKQGRIELRNSSGAMISVSETISGNGIFSFETGNLATGLYCCSLVIDGRLTATRKISLLH